MFNTRNWDRKSQLSGILTEPLNPREGGGFPRGAQRGTYQKDSKAGLIMRGAKGGLTRGAQKRLYKRGTKKLILIHQY